MFHVNPARGNSSWVSGDAMETLFSHVREQIDSRGASEVVRTAAIDTSRKGPIDTCH